MPSSEPSQEKLSPMVSIRHLTTSESHDHFIVPVWAGVLIRTTVEANKIWLSLCKANTVYTTLGSFEKPTLL